MEFPSQMNCERQLSLWVALLEIAAAEKYFVKDL